MYRKLLLLISIVCIVITIPLSLSAQTVIYTEGFEQGVLSSAWSQAQSEGSSTAWGVSTAGISTVTTAAEGQYYAYFVGTTADTGNKLITSFQDVAALSQLQLSFSLIQPAYSGNVHDELRVYARDSSTAPWNLIASFNEAIGQWSMQDIVIPEEYASWIQLAFEFNSGNGRGIGIDQIKLGNVANCIDVSGLSVSRITDNGATLNWGDQNYAYNYEIKISTTAITDFTAPANVCDSVIFTAPADITGLLANTQYFFYVRANCRAGGYSEWSQGVSFTTLCASTQLPLTENFDSYTTLTNPFPTCWNRLMKSSGDWSGYYETAVAYQAQCVSGGYNNSVGAMKMQSFYNENNQSYNPLVVSNYVSTQSVQTTSLTACQLSFYINSTDLRYELHVGVMSDPLDETTFERVTTVKAANMGLWEQVIIPFDTYSGNGKYVALMMEGGNGTNLTQSMLIDDLQISTINPCAKPTLLRAESVTANSVRLKWNGVSSSYRLVVSSIQIDPTTQNGDIFDGSVTTNNQLLTALNANTTYYFYVLNNCTPQSTWSEEANFSTACGAIVEFPHTENFESYGTQGSGWFNAFPTCWSRIQNISTAQNYPYISPMSLVNGSALYFYSSTNLSAIAVMPEMGVDVSGLKLSFNAVITNPECGIIVGVMTDPTDSATFVEVSRIYPEQTIAFLNYSVYFDQYSGTGRYIAFKSQRDYNNYFYLDDVVVEELASCMPAYELDVENVTANSATATWNQVMGANAYRLKLSNTALTNPNTTFGLLKDTTVTTNSLLLSGLSGSSNYYLYIQTLCDGENSEWVEKYFRTECGTVTALPFYENFDNTTPNTIPNCWKVVQYVNNMPYVSTATNDYDYKGSPSLRFRTSNALVASPAIAGSLNGLQLSFFLAQENSSAGNMVVGVMTDTTDISTFMPLDTFSLNNYLTPTYLEVDLTRPQLTATDYHIVFKQQSNSNYDSFWVDEVTVEAAPSCGRISTTNLLAVLDQSATLSWQAAQSEQTWRIAIGQAPYYPGDAHGTYYTVQAPMFKVLNLTAETTYDYFIQAICAPADTAQWSRASSFTTSGAVAQVPYSFGFEIDDESNNWVISNGASVNQWCVGQATAVTGSNALYISNDGGISNTYSYTMYAHRTHAYAYRTLALEEGQYYISFDWRANGYQGVDLLAAFLVPATVEMLEGGLGDNNGNKPYNSYQFNANDLKEGWQLIGGSVLQLSNYWQTFSQSVTITEAGAYRLVFYWTNGYQSWASNFDPPAAIDNVSVTPLTCGIPSNIEVEMTSTTAQFSWLSFNSPTQWEAKVSSTPISLSALEGVTTDIYDATISQDVVNVTGLTGNTTYYFYVRSICSETDKSQWQLYEFKTPCDGIASLPYSENFNAYTTYGQKIDCWNVVGQANGGPTSYTYLNYGGGSGASLYFNAPSNGGESIITIPRLENDSVKNTMVTFYAYYYNAGASIQVGVVSNLNDPSSFASIHTHTITRSSSWEFVEVDMSSYEGDGQYIAFSVSSSDPYSYGYFFIDNVAITRQNPCKKIRTMNVDRVDPTNARLTWNELNVAATYTIMVSTAPFDPETNQNADVYEMVQDNYLYLSSLTPGTTYYAYIRSECDGEFYSDWSDQVSFKLPCQGVNLPLVETFAQGTPYEELPCWLSLVNVSGSVAIDNTMKPQVAMNTDDGADGRSYKLYSAYSETVSGSNTNYNHSRSIAILPLVNANVQALQLSLNHFTDYYGSHLYVGVMEDPTDYATLELYDSLQLGSWKESIINFSNYSGNGNYIALFTDAQKTAMRYTAYIDNIVLDSIRNCQAPTSPWATGVTDNQATLHWGSVTGMDTLWHLQVSLVDLGSNVEELDNMQDFVVDTLIAQPWATISNLNPETTYFYYVRSVCGNNAYSERYKKSMNFTTSCVAQMLPLFENFDTEASFNGCWQIALQNEISSQAPTWSLNSTSQYTYEGSGSAIMSAMREFYNSYLISPKVSIPAANQYRVRFMMYRTNTTTNDEGINLWINSTPDTIGATLLNSVNRSVELSPVVDAQGWYEYIDTIPMAGNYYIIFEGKNRSGSSIYIDNVAIESINACERVTFIRNEKVQATQANVLWENNAALPIEYAVGVTGFDPNTATITPIGLTSSVVVTGLTPNTDYDVYVRSVCGNSNAGVWMKTSFKTKQQPAALPYAIDFETTADNDLWTIIGTNANKFYMGNAVAYTGNNALYISNEIGNNNQYTTTQESYAFAYRTIHFKGGNYNINFKWHAMGESGADYGRVFLAPASTVILPNSNNQIYSTYSIPEGWINIGYLLLGQSEWQTFNENVAIDKDADYHLVIYWVNNANGVGANPALAIDDLTVEVNSCHTPFNAHARMIEGDNAIITVATDAQQVQMKLDTRYFTLSNVDVEEAFIDTMVNGNSALITGLAPLTQYYLWIRTVCNGDTTAWIEGNSFTTVCGPQVVTAELSYVEDFENYIVNYTAVRPDCWYGNSFQPSYYPTIVNNSYNAYQGDKYFSLRVNQVGSNSYVTLPEFTANIQNLQIRFFGRNGYSGVKGIRVGVMSDKEDVSTFEQVAILPHSSEYTEHLVNFANYIGTGKYIALLADDGSIGTYTDYSIDNLVVEFIAMCQQPSMLVASEVSAYSAKINFMAEQTQNQWQIKVTTQLLDNPTTDIALIDTLINATEVQLNNLTPNTFYYYYVRSICGANDTSAWSSAAYFMTECAAYNARMIERFEGALFPSHCWIRSNSSLNAVMQGENLNVTTIGWSQNNSAVFGSQHAAVSVDRSNVSYWLVTPEVAVADSSALTFRLAKSGVNSALNGNIAADNDRFMVMVSTNGGATWDVANATVWSGQPTAQYQLNALTHQGVDVEINLAAYTNQTIKVAFYVENQLIEHYQTYDLHIDDVRINNRSNFVIEDAICSGYNYEFNGFNIPMNNLLPENSPFTFTRVGLAETGCDSTIILDLEVLPSVEHNIVASICDNEVYNENGFNFTEPGVYRTYNNAANGCDSITILTLVVNPTYVVNDAVEISQGDLPYSYLDTIFDLNTPLGVTQHELHTQTEHGCDSIVHLVLQVQKGTAVGTLIMNNATLYPNPIQIGNVTTLMADYSVEECQDMVVEIYNQLGQLILTIRPNEFPLHISGLEQSGVYMVRIRKQNEVLFRTKLIVQ